MDERVRFVTDWYSGGFTMAELCDLYGISRKTGYKWLSRHRDGGFPGLADRSRAPLSNPRSMDDAVVELLVSEREKHPTWGARKLVARLSEQHPELEWPSTSGAHKVLRRAGLVKRRRRRRSALPDSSGGVEADGPNAVWSADYKGEFRLGDRSLCYPLTISDSYSRYLLACRSLSSTKTEFAVEVFDATFREFGLPEVLRTDNGTPFASAGAGRLTRLAVWLLKLGIILDRTRPAHPEDNGRHERMHRTLKAETARPPSYSASSQDARFMAFIDEYNNERPHESLGMVPPCRHYVASPRSYDGSIPEVWYPGHWEVRSLRSNGEIKWRGKRYFVSETLGEERVGLLEVDDGIWWVVFMSHPVAVYDAHRDTMRPVLSGMRGNQPGFSALRATDEEKGRA